MSLAKEVRDVLAGGSAFGMDPNDVAPLNAVDRKYDSLPGTPKEDELTQGVAACLHDPDPSVRGQALIFFENHPKAAGGEELPSCAPAPRNPTTSVPNPTPKPPTRPSTPACEPACLSVNAPHLSPVRGRAELAARLLRSAPTSTASTSTPAAACRERLCRYGARPPLNAARLSLRPDGRLVAWPSSPSSPTSTRAAPSPPCSSTSASPRTRPASPRHVHPAAQES